ncbi:MAG: cupin domain-containing protein [Myxococcales bacterium]|nr:cupin domain-containing protein [Myxococcales bacterium]
MGAYECRAQVARVMKQLALALALITLVACTREGQREPLHEPTSPFEVLGSEFGVSMARVHLGPSRTFRFEAGPCQEVLVFVEKGTARVGLTWLDTGRAARFHAPALLQGMSNDGTVIFAVAALSKEAAIEQVDWARVPKNPSCPPRSNEVVLSDPERSGPFVHAGGRLSVMIYLDGVRDGPPVASLGTLTADSTLAVPEHLHERSAEVLWIQDGSGTMRVGDQTRAIRPGTFVRVPPQTLHGFVPDGTRPLLAYQVYTPSGPEQRFR